MTWDSGFLLSWGARKRAQIQESIDCNIMKCTHTKGRARALLIQLQLLLSTLFISCDMFLIFLIDISLYEALLTIAPFVSYTAFSHHQLTLFTVIFLVTESKDDTTA